MYLTIFHSVQVNESYTHSWSCQYLLWVYDSTLHSPTWSAGLRWTLLDSAGFCRTWPDSNLVTYCHMLEPLESAGVHQSPLEYKIEFCPEKGVQRVRWSPPDWTLWKLKSDCSPDKWVSSGVQWSPPDWTVHFQETYNIYILISECPVESSGCYDFEGSVTNPIQSFVRMFWAKKSSNDESLVYLSGLREIEIKEDELTN